MKNTFTDHSVKLKPHANLCLVPDNFIAHKPRWIATLSNGETVYQDDGRKGCYPPSAWLRLGAYIKETKLKIVEVKLQFRSHIESPLPTSAPGYFFCHKSAALQGAVTPATVNFFLVGTLCSETTNVILQLWKVPELVFCGHSVRMIDNCKKGRLIFNEEKYYEPFLG